MEKLHYVYTLAYPDGKVFYVGKGKGRRINRHEQEARNGVKSYKCNVIRKIWAQGGQVMKKKLALFETHSEAIWYEIALIFFMEGLTNETYGGEGTIGQVYSEEYRRKLSIAGSKPERIAQLRKVHELTRGRKQTEEQRRKTSEALKGKKHTEERRRRNSEAQKIRPPITEEARQKLSESGKGRKHSEETRRKMSETAKQRSEEYRRKMSEVKKGHVLSEEGRRKVSEYQKTSPKAIEQRRILAESRKGKPSHAHSTLKNLAYTNEH